MMDWVASLKNTGQWLLTNRNPLGLCLCMIILPALFLYLYYIALAMNTGPEQPIAFSHRLHTGVKEIQCRFCHPYVDRSSFPGIPPVEKCLYCHNYIIANHPEIKKEHEYYDSKTPTPWVKVNYVPEHVFFNHQRHIKKDIDCRECHGAIETMDRLKDAEFEMGFCVDCHKVKDANLDCWLACHN
jgi:hypothetical protein